MNDDIESLDELLREHFRAELDLHAGRAAKTFAKRLRGHTSGMPRRLMVWALWSAGAVAATVGIVWGMTQQVAQPPIRKAKTVAADRPWPMAQVEHRQNVDEGTVILDEFGPARRVRQEIVQTTTYYDPAGGGQLEVTVPAEEVAYVALQPH
jgi:hypothetical protein